MPTKSGPVEASSFFHLLQDTGLFHISLVSDPFMQQCQL